MITGQDSAFQEGIARVDLSPGANRTSETQDGLWFAKYANGESQRLESKSAKRRAETLSHRYVWLLLPTE
jgi:hypothetical protein